jgi:tRNA1Val (adenine37-N6)-methyltransferase
VPSQPATDAQARRAFFPRGLVQPKNGFRFAADTLLLAAFAAQDLSGRRRLRGLDMGCGCGAASLGLLLLRPELDMTLDGIDTNPEMVACAAQNARALGLEERFAPLLADAADHRAGCNSAPCDFALANPPFRRPGTGRACPDPERGRARFEGPEGFDPFAACAARNLRTRGKLFLLHLSERLPEIFAALSAHGLEPKRLLPVQGHPGQAPRLSLVLAMRAAAPGLDLRPPLVLYGPNGDISPQALAFCPQLAANARRSVIPTPAPLANDYEED